MQNPSEFHIGQPRDRFTPIEMGLMASRNRTKSTATFIQFAWKAWFLDAGSTLGKSDV